MTSPLVSVVIPLFNANNFIKETVQSVLDQSYQSIEIIIVDDGSTDGSYETANSIRSNKIKVFHNKGKGACAARNYGYELSKGQYIQFLDADDLLSVDKIELQVVALHGEEKKICVCKTIHFTDSPNNGINKDAAYLFSTTNPGKFFITLWGGNALPINMVQTSAWLTHRKLIDKAGGWNENLTKDQDGEFFARIGLLSEGIIYVPEVKNFYRKHATGKNIASKKQRGHVESMLEATRLKSSYLLKKDESEKAYRAIATLYKQVAIEAWPQYYDVYIKANKKSKEYGYSPYVPLLGGTMVESVKNIFGWRIAKLLSHYGHKLVR